MMPSADELQVQAEARGAVPEASADFAVQKVRSLLRLAPEPVLFARVQAGDAGRPAHEWRHDSMPSPRPRYFQRSQEQRRVIRHKSYTLGRRLAEDAAADMELLDYDFHLFTDKETGLDSVIYRSDGGYRLAQTRPEPSRPAPCTARSR